MKSIKQMKGIRVVHINWVEVLKNIPAFGMMLCAMIDTTIKVVNCHKNKKDK